MITLLYTPRRMCEDALVERGGITKTGASRVPKRVVENFDGALAAPPGSPKSALFACRSAQCCQARGCSGEPPSNNPAVSQSIYQRYNERKNRYTTIQQT